MDTYNIIKDNLSRNHVFYIPEEAISKLESTVYNGAIPLEACNTLAFFNNEKKVSTDFKKITVFNLLDKKDILDENISLLYQAKKTLDEKHFRFLLDKYVVLFDAHLVTNIWLFENLQRIFNNAEDSIINLFKIQKEYYERHKFELNQHFEIKCLEYLNQNQNIAKYFEETFSNPDFKIEVPKFPKNNSLLKPKVKPVRKKKVLMTDEEAEHFLLKTVFNVDM